MGKAWQDDVFAFQAEFVSLQILVIMNMVHGGCWIAEVSCSGQMYIV